jgi:hypothetical protein
MLNGKWEIELSAFSCQLSAVSSIGDWRRVAMLIAVSDAPDRSFAGRADRAGSWKLAAGSWKLEASKSNFPLR